MPTPPAAPNKFDVTDPGVLDQIEGTLCSVRVSELDLAPLPGSFDAAHLLAVHQHIMQDVYDHAGKCRAAGPTAKNRTLSDGTRYRVEYFNGADIPGALTAALASSAKRLTGLDPGNRGVIAQAVATTYADLDYIHPFHEGNSRSLRAFVSQMVFETTGFKLRWDPTKLDETSMAQARDRLYMARDKAVLPRALAAATDERAMFQIARAIAFLKLAPGLEQVILDGLRDPAAAENENDQITDDNARPRQRG